LEDKVKIKVSVAGRSYPLKVTPTEEEFVRKSVSFIEERMNYIEKKYAIKDIQDVQALILIELASELHYLKRTKNMDIKMIEEKINHLIEL